jgi:hypothetical protein
MATEQALQPRQHEAVDGDDMSAPMATNWTGRLDGRRAGRGDQGDQVQIG